MRKIRKFGACLAMGVAATGLIAGSASAQTTIENDAPISMTGSKGSQTVFVVNLPAGSTDLTISTSGGKGDLTLYAKAGSIPNSGSFDCRSAGRGNNETCGFPGDRSGAFFVMIEGVRDYKNTSLVASFTMAPPPPEPFSVSKIAGIGDSITRAFGADCIGNVWLWDLACLLEGDQPYHSWFDGWSSNVESVHDKFRVLDDAIAANKDASDSGAEMLGIGNSNRNFLDQANIVVGQSPVADHVEVVLGGNDICNRGCTDARNCADPLYTESEWRGAIQDGLDVLMNGMPEGGTVVLGSVPRVQNLRDAGLEKEAGRFGINCQSLWSTFDVCRIVTDGGTLNGEGLRKRHNAIADTQRLYNEVLRDEASAYNSNSNGRNPRGIEVVAEYVDEATLTAGTFDFTADNINGGDCFHPNVPTQSTIADFMWTANPEK